MVPKELHSFTLLLSLQRLYPFRAPKTIVVDFTLFGAVLRLLDAVETSTKLDS